MERDIAFWKDFQRLWVRLAMDGGHIKKPDVVYIPALSEGMLSACAILETAASYAVSMEVNFVSFDGQGGLGSGGWVDHPSATEYARRLVKMGVDASVIVPTRPGKHTRDECDALVELAKEKGWLSAIFVTVPYHWPRVLSCLVGSMAMHDYDLRVSFPAPSQRVEWYERMKGSQGRVDTTFIEEAGADLERFVGYLEQGAKDDGLAWKQRYGAPFTEMFRYLDWRDSIDRR